MKDLFSAHPDEYARYRPVYPPNLYRFLVEQIPHTRLAWDAGTGNGQSAVALSAYFDSVVATDISRQQLAAATAMPNLTYHCAPAEDSGIPSGSADLVTVAQALHWFNREAFYEEVRRVAAPGACLAAWCYSLLQTGNHLDQLLADFHHHFLGPYWDEERVHVMNGYRDLHFPFTPVPAPEFFIEVQWTMSHLEGYLNTWSAVQRY